MQTVELGGLVKIWTSAIKAAEEAKAGFTKTGEICSSFFTGAMDAMWDDNFRNRFLGGLPTPQFRLTLNKTFELTSIVGPALMWANPGRQVSIGPKLKIDPTVIPVLYGLDPNTPEGQQAAQQWAMEQANDEAVAEATAAIMAQYLNYAQREQPGGGLQVDSRLAVIDALIKGRGVLRTDAYRPYGADYELTGSFRIDVDDLFIDPNCTRGNLSNAKWIAIRHRDPHWQVERQFGWPPGSLKGKGASSLTHMGSQLRQSNVRQGKHKIPVNINDMVVWYEIFSLCGVGTRFNGSGAQEWHQAFEDNVGDEAYLCICPGVNELLNFRNADASAIELDKLKAKLDWPIPYYKDARWPIAPLDFWDNPKSCWPIATVSAGLGQLVIMNVILCSIADRTYRDSLDKVAISSVLDDNARAKLLSLKHEVIELNPAAGEKIDQFLSYVQRPQMNFDVWRILEEMSLSFDKAVGLMELMYGLNPGGKVSRSAADANIKGDAVGVRPEFMAARVEEWQSNVANNERIAAGNNVGGRGLVPLLGKSGAMLWEKLITQADPQVYLREMRCQVEAGSTRRPNKVREAQNMQQVSAFLLPVAQWYAGTTGNTTPLNKLIEAVGDSIEQDTTDWMMPPVNTQPPEPTPEEIQARELEVAKQKATVDKLSLNNTEKAHKMLSEGIGMDPSQLADVEMDQAPQQETFLGEPVPQN